MQAAVLVALLTPTTMQSHCPCDAPSHLLASEANDSGHWQLTRATESNDPSPSSSLIFDHIELARSTIRMADDKPRHIAISAADGHTGMAVAELLLRHDKFKGAVSSVTALTYSDGAEAKQLEKLGAEVVTIEERGSLKGAMESIDTMLIIPPARAVSASLGLGRGTATHRSHFRPHRTSSSKSKRCYRKRRGRKQ
jgi:hypothetical protein